MRFYELKCDACEKIGALELSKEELIRYVTNPHRSCPKTPPGKISARELKIIIKPIPDKYKEKLEEYRDKLENVNYTNIPISDDIIIHYERSVEEKIKFVESLHNRALIDMKAPKITQKDGVEYITRVSDFMASVNASIASRNQLYSCLLCGIGVHPKYIDEVKNHTARYILELRPHEIVYHFLDGDFKPENIVMLCGDCHDKEYKLIKEHCLETMKKNVKNWEKLIEISFDCFKRVIKYLDKQQESPR